MSEEEVTKIEIPEGKELLECESCGKEFVDNPPQMCCSGWECGCRGMPVDPIVCSNDCHNNLMDGVLSEKVLARLQREKELRDQRDHKWTEEELDELPF